MTRVALAALAAFWLAGCGIYGPPERAATPAQPAAAEQCPEPEDTQ